LKFSNFELLGFGLIAFILFIFLQVLGKGLPYVIKQPEYKRVFLKYFTMSEIFVWIVYTIFVIQQLSDSFLDCGDFFTPQFVFWKMSIESFLKGRPELF